MGILGPIIEPAARFLAHFISDDFHRRSVGLKPVRHYHFRTAVSFHRLLQKLQCSLAISLLCNECFKHFTLVIDCPPQVVGFAIDPHEYLVEMPAPLRAVSMRGRQILSDLCREHRTKTVPPCTYGLVADVDSPLVERIFGLPQRQGKTDIHHHCQANDLRRRLKISERIFHPRTL